MTTPPGFDPALRARIELTVSCRDCDGLPKVESAGEVIQEGQQALQIMHNGVRVQAGGYYGDWMAEIIRRLQGHHEPQEELAYHEVVQRLCSDTAAPTMVECGAFWGYYSLWLLESAPGASVTLIEPDPNYLAIGEQNFRLNGRSGVFINAAVAGDHQETAPFTCESDGVERLISYESLPSLWKRLNMDRLDLLHIDAQGAELPFLHSGREILAGGRIRFCIVSTHHHIYSGDPRAHEQCLKLFQDLGAHIVAEHTVAESFSGDGLICAAFRAGDQDLFAPISRARARDSLFGDPVVELAACGEELSRVKQQSDDLAAHLEEARARARALDDGHRRPLPRRAASWLRRRVRG